MSSHRRHSILAVIDIVEDFVLNFFLTQKLDKQPTSLTPFLTTSYMIICLINGMKEGYYILQGDSINICQMRWISQFGSDWIRKMFYMD